NLCKRIYAVGIPATINLGLPSLLITALNGILAGISATAVLVLGAYYKLRTFIYLTANGIVQGIRPIVGYNYGAGEFKRVDKIFQTSLLMIASVMAVGTVLCLSASGSLIGLFTDNAETVQMGKTALRIICAGFIVSSVSVTASGVMEALGKGNMSLIISLMRYLVVIVPVAFLLSRFLGATGVWAAFPVAELLTALTSWLLYQKQIKAKLLHGFPKAAPQE
ncbi:MAG TPA: MATE family efflux transporter, partial [Clostridiales bacterium]|nr:MATE family efflux transporter [Clostridiales bacterium]